MSRARGAVMPLDQSLRRLQAQSVPILALRFPNFRNLAADTTIKFDFPITVLLGRNGTNKSSVLHALYGAPRGNTIAEFWFETDLDAIPDTNDKGLSRASSTSTKTTTQLLNASRLVPPGARKIQTTGRQ